MACEYEMVNGENILSDSPLPERDLKVINYDFKRPDKFSLDQIRTLSNIHETFARLTTSSISAQLRSKVSLSVKCVDQLTFGEFIHSLPNPAAMAILNLSPLEGSAILEISPNISSAITDRLLGGKGNTLDDNRELSNIEGILIEGIVTRMFGNLKGSWSHIVELSPSLEKVESKPQHAMVLPPSEMVILVSFEILFGDIKGCMNFCIPYLTIEPIIGKLSSQYWFSQIKKENNTDILSNNIISSLKMDSEVVVQTEDLTLKQLGSLRKGSLVKLDGFTNGKSALRMGGKIILDPVYRKNRKNDSFVFDPEKNVTSADIKKIMGTRMEIKDSESLQDSMKEISEQILHVSKDINNRIGELSTSQDLLNDQVLLQNGGEGLASRIVEKPFGFIGLPEIENLYQIISADHPQLKALVLSRLDSILSARLLEMFDSNVQIDLIRRISQMERIAPLVMADIERVLEEKLDMMTSNLEPAPVGIDKVTEILNNSSRSVEKSVVESLENMDNDLAEEIKKRIFVFEDIVLLDKKTVALIVQRSDPDDLYLSMKVVDEKVKKYIFGQITKEDQSRLEEGIGNIGRVKISDIDKAQQRIVSLIRDMEENGEVLVLRPDEMVE